METKLAHQHLHDGTLLLYDVSSSYYTGTQAGLVQSFRGSTGGYRLAKPANEITLIEADCTRFYAPDKGDFRGRAATEAVRAAGATTTLVYAEIAATDCDIYGGQAVMHGGPGVRVWPSGAYGCSHPFFFSARRT